MINPDHYKSVIENNTKLLKLNTRLNAAVIALRKDHESFREQTLKKLETTLRLYDSCNEKVVNYLIRNNLIGNSGDHHKNICELFPIKIGGKK